MWWKHDGDNFEEVLKPFKDDGDARELGVFAYVNNIGVEIYTEEKPVTGEETFIDKVREKGKGIMRQEEVEEGVEYESSDESLKDVHFDDSEEERMNESDESGLEEGVDEGVEAGLKQRVDLGHSMVLVLNQVNK